ncbi:Glycogen synthase [Leminorella richardii]|uniref:Glycogen synthase n=1 Tax=Leminorella richardii TaxID=158841 RepID=A0A2X4V883_9GAMM|nr:glycogen synthase GlgA [Leminorella richardii]SQI41510.1 Glycogen synthase [Leminorella richardii]
MRVLHVCSELFPLLKTGGLADVLGALPQAQIAAGADVRLLMPGFPALMQQIHPTSAVAEIDTFAGRVTLRYGSYNGVGVYLIDAPHLYDRPGSPYHDASQHEYADNYRRFGLLGWIACELACGLDALWRPEVVHGHDWHAGLASAYLAARGYPARSVFTVHNLAYQGLFSSRHMNELYLPSHFLQPEGLEFYGQISYLKAGLYYSDMVTAVSPTYAEEITQAEYGFGMENLLKQRQEHGKLAGILNGVDYEVWSPEKDALLSFDYSSSKLADKAKNKAQLQSKTGLDTVTDAPLFAVVSRLSAQKGLDLLLQALPDLLDRGGQLVLLGSGDEALQEAYLDAARRHPKQVAVKIGYDETLAHHIIGSADVILVPSRFEPCGLTQLYGLRYGTLPLVRHTGGLADTVSDCSLENLADKSATGFVFHDSRVEALSSAIRRAFALWAEPPRWRRVQKQAMAMDFSWHNAAQKYLALYQKLG